MRRRWLMRLELNQWEPHLLKVANLSNLHHTPTCSYCSCIGKVIVFSITCGWRISVFFLEEWQRCEKWMSHPSRIPLWSSERQLAPAPWKREQGEWAANGPSNALMSTVTECWVSSKLVLGNECYMPSQKINGQPSNVFMSQCFKHRHKLSSCCT